MRYTQKKQDTEITISLDTQNIFYAIKDAKSKAEFTHPYEDIMINRYEITESNDGYKNQATYLFVVGLVLLIVGFGFLFLIGAGIFLFLYKRSKMRFTVIDANQKRLYILHDTKHDEIIDNLYKNRNKYLKHKYAIIEHHNDPAFELKKFQWLLDQQVITQDEFDDFKFQLMKKDNKILN